MSVISRVVRSLDKASAVLRRREAKTVPSGRIGNPTMAWVYARGVTAVCRWAVMDGLHGQSGEDAARLCEAVFEGEFGYRPGLTSVAASGAIIMGPLLLGENTANNSLIEVVVEIRYAFLDGLRSDYIPQRDFPKKTSTR